MRLTVVGCSDSIPGPDNDPAQSLAAAAGTVSGPVSLAAPGQVLELG